MANEFGTGFGQGLNYYTKFAEMQQNKLLDEERLKTERLRQEGYKLELDEKKETRDVRMEGIQSESEFQSARAKKYQTETDEFIANADNRRQNADLLLDTNKNNLNVSELQAASAKINLESAKKAVVFNDWINAIDISSNESLGVYQKAELMEDGLEQISEYIDPKKFVSDEYWQGWEKITPQLEAGDFEGIVKDHSDVLDTIYKESLKSFEGKNFLAKDGRKGVIQNVKLSGNFNPIENTANSLVGGTYSVLFEGQEEAEEVFTFMPDKNQYAKTIKEDQEGTDAKVVSIADMVDVVAAEKDVAMFFINNPKSLEALDKAVKGKFSITGTVDQKAAKSKLYFDQKNSAKKRYGDILKTASKAAEDSGEESDYLGSLYRELPGTVGTENIEQITDDYGYYEYKYKEGKSSSTIDEQYNREYINLEKITAEVENAYARFESFEGRLKGQKALYNFGGVAQISFDKTSSYLDATLEDIFGEEKYNEYREDAVNFYPKAYPGKKLEDISDAQYIAFMEAFINRRISTGN